MRSVCSRVIRTIPPQAKSGRDAAIRQRNSGSTRSGSAMPRAPSTPTTGGRGVRRHRVAGDPVEERSVIKAELARTAACSARARTRSRNRARAPRGAGSASWISWFVCAGRWRSGRGRSKPWAASAIRRAASGASGSAVRTPSESLQPMVGAAARRLRGHGAIRSGAVPPPERLAIAQVTPFAWEAPNEVGEYVAKVSDELAGRGHRVLIIAPSQSAALVRDSRRALRGDLDKLLARADGQPLVLGVGEVLPFSPMRRRAASMPVDVARTIEEALRRCRSTSSTSTSRSRRAPPASRCASRAR